MTAGSKPGPKKGYKQTPEHTRKVALAITGSHHGLWKGDDVGRTALHNWIRRHKPDPGFCEACGKTGKTDVANISGQYVRHVSDFQYLCRRCHMLSDERLMKLKERIVAANKARIGTPSAPWTTERRERHRISCNTEEHRKKLSRALKGKRFSEEHKLKLKLAWTPERKQNASLACTPEMRQKAGERFKNLNRAKIGKPLSEEHRNRISRSIRAKRLRNSLH